MHIARSGAPRWLRPLPWRLAGGAGPPRPALHVTLLLFAGTAFGRGGPAELVEMALRFALPAALFAGLWLTGRTGRAALALALALAASSLARPLPPAPGAGASGRWHALLERRGEAVGVLGGGGERFLLPAGAIAEGELVSLTPAREATRPARGPLSRWARAGPAPPRRVELDEIVRLAPPPRGALARLGKALAEMRRRCLARLAGIADPRSRALVRALVCGDHSELSPALADRFTRTGTRHLLAVSGLHVGLVAAAVVWPLAAALATLARLAGAFGPRGAARLAAFARVVLLAALAPLAGGAAPVVRAAIVLSLASLAPVLARRPDPARGDPGVRRADGLSLVATAAACEGLCNPAALASISFQLSYAATLGLLVAARPLDERVRRRLPGGGRLARHDRLGRPRVEWIRVPLARLAAAVRLSLVASAVAVIATLPIVWSRFGEIGVFGAAATLLALPPVVALLVGGWLRIALPSAGLELALAAAARLLEGVLAAFDRLPGTPLALPPRPFLLLALASAATLAALARGGRGAARLAALAGGIALLPWAPAPAEPELHLLDVGHGTAAVLRIPGAPTILFDAGSRDRPGVARALLEPLLAGWEVRRPIVVASDRQRDHSGALPRLAQRFPPRLWLGASPQEAGVTLEPTTPRADATGGALELRIGPPTDPTRLFVLRGAALSGNEGSRTLVVEHGGERWILSGDAEERGLAAMLAGGGLDGPAAVLTLPHHGSPTPFLFDLLEHARPQEVWASAPTMPEAAGELRRRAIPLRVTGRDGPLLHRGAHTAAAAGAP